MCLNALGRQHCSRRYRGGGGAGKLAPTRGLHCGPVDDISPCFARNSGRQPQRVYKMASLHQRDGAQRPQEGSALSNAAAIVSPRPGRRGPTSQLPRGYRLHRGRGHVVDLFRHRRLVALLADRGRRRGCSSKVIPRSLIERAPFAWLGASPLLMAAATQTIPGFFPNYANADRDRLRDGAVAVDRPLCPLLSRLHRVSRHLRGPEAVDRRPPARPLDLRHAASSHRCHLHAHLGRQLHRHDPDDGPAGAALDDQLLRARRLRRGAAAAPVPPRSRRPRQHPHPRVPAQDRRLAARSRGCCGACSSTSSTCCPCSSRARPHYYRVQHVYRAPRRGQRHARQPDDRPLRPHQLPRLQPPCAEAEHRSGDGPLDLPLHAQQGKTRQLQGAAPRPGRSGRRR